jgi:DhnA family fructose-bisphosphate aldolase class Ia
LKEIRLGHIFGKDGRAVVVACDHAGFMGTVKGLEDPGILLDALVDSGVDAVLTTMGVARRFGNRLGKLGLILRADGGASMRSPTTGTLRTIFNVKDACRLGADAVICMGMIGYPEEPSSLQNLAALSAEAEVWGMPVVAEMLVKPKEGENIKPEDIGFAMRIGAELGADLIKASFARPLDSYKIAVAACYRPVVVLGGEKVKDEREMLQAIADALAAGVRGVAIGRNVWQHSNPAGVCRALVALVHGGASVESAMKEIGG